MNVSRKRFPDLVFEPRSGGAPIVVEVKHRYTKDAVTRVQRELEQYAIRWAEPAFTFLADLDRITVYRRTDLSVPLASFSTRDILRSYDPRYGDTPVFEDYIRTLIDVWLDDLTIHWKNEQAPGEEEMPADVLRVLQAA